MSCNSQSLRHLQKFPPKSFLHFQGIGGTEAEPQDDSGFIADKANEPHGCAHGGRASAKFELDDLMTGKQRRKRRRRSRTWQQDVLLFRTKDW